MTRPVLNQNSPLVDIKTGKVIPPWNSFFQQFTEAPSAIQNVLVGFSPFLYTPNNIGQVCISGGTVSDISFIRGLVSISLFNSTALPRLVLVSIKDTVSITYSVLPTVRFIEL